MARWQVALATALLVSALVAASDAPPSAPFNRDGRLGAYHLVWPDEFDGERGELTHETGATAFPRGRASVWLTCIPGPLGGTKRVDDSKLPAEAVFDWVRVYES
jgi:hypothetical protein